MAVKSSNQKKSPQKVIWALDPFSSEPAVLRSAAWCLHGLSQAESLFIQPVFVWSSRSGRSALVDDHKFLSALEQRGNDRLSEVLDRIKIDGLQPIHVVAREAQSVRDEARELVDYAHEVGAQSILVLTHGRKGVSRIVLGSFAETLSLCCDIPLLTVHPNWNRSPEFKKILFATDFSSSSKKAFEKVLDFAEVHQSAVTLFHKSDSPLYPLYEFGLCWTPFFEDLVKVERTFSEQNGQDWIADAAKRGIAVDLIMDPCGTVSISEAILTKAGELECMIALAAQAGKTGAVLLGNTTRRVIRLSEWPVWTVVVPSDPAEGKKRSPVLVPEEEDLDHDLMKRDLYRG